MKKENYKIKIIYETTNKTRKATNSNQRIKFAERFY